MTTKTYDGQTARFIASVATCIPPLSGDVMQGWIDNPQALKKVLGGLNPSATKKSDTIICVDRSVRPSYPDWVKTVMHPDLEPTGPAEYDITTVKQWLHDGQKDGKWIEGNKIHTHLKETDTLKTCLGLRDLEEIQKKGIVFFRKHFQSKAVFAWKSVVLSRVGDLLVPCLCEGGVEVVMFWSWLGNDWNDDDPALRFAS